MQNFSVMGYHLATQEIIEWVNFLALPPKKMCKIFCHKNYCLENVQQNTCCFFVFEETNAKNHIMSLSFQVLELLTLDMDNVTGVCQF